MIELNSLTKTFNKSQNLLKGFLKKTLNSTITAVDQISFQCQPGRIFGLIGPNGAGKTTTLRMIATMLKPTTGSISVGGFDTIKNPIEVRSKLGFLSGNTGLYDRLTADEMVKYYADLHGMDSTKYQSKRDEIFQILDMNEFAHRRIGKLSTGMKQKVSIARTIIHDPDVVVFEAEISCSYIS